MFHNLVHHFNNININIINISIILTLIALTLIHMFCILIHIGALVFV